MIAASSLYLALGLAALASRVNAYSLSKQWRGADFMNGDWNFENSADPTHGTVEYVAQQEATDRGMAAVIDNQFHMAADTTTPGPRKSVRISTKEKWKDSVVILDLAHMPAGCGTWPAFWTVGDSWPNNGEIDILEGVNIGSPNAATLHTSTGCTMEGVQRSQNGQAGHTNCDAADGNNIGCGVTFTEPNNYGQGFNANGGGWFAMQRSSDGGIYVWFWPRLQGAPGDVAGVGPSVDPAGWGVPSAAFPPTSCNIGQFFGDHSLVFDLTFCGDWAGAVFDQTCGDKGDCNNYVMNTPGDFGEAYWRVNSVTVYGP